jgi:hypothetical protein
VRDLCLWPVETPVLPLLALITAVIFLSLALLPKFARPLQDRNAYKAILVAFLQSKSIESVPCATFANTALYFTISD